MSATTVDPLDLADTLRQHQQDHLLVGVDELDPAAREAYLVQLAAVDWAELGQHAAAVSPDDVAPSTVLTLAEQRSGGDDIAALGEQAYQDGTVAVLMVAGGQGSRLGFSGPKGCFELAAHSGKSIYQWQAEKVLSLSRRVGQAVPFLVMTSPYTDRDTQDFFAVNDHFGLDPEQVRFFCQGTVPSIDQDGKALRSGPDSLLTNPDGHGGCFTALVNSGTLAWLQQRGIKHLVYIQVDNVLAPVDDPMLVGFAIQRQADVVTKVLEKAYPDEKLGHLVRLEGRDRIVEYTELSPEQVRLPGPDGHPLFRWGSPAMMYWSVAFFVRLAAAGHTLPLHRSRKPLKAWQDGAISEVTGWKCERFIFDLLPAADASFGLEIERGEEFAPVKNATGVDSVESAQRLASDCYRRWLTAAGVSVPEDERVLIEISPLFAATAEQFSQRWQTAAQTPSQITGDYYLEPATES